MVDSGTGLQVTSQTTSLMTHHLRRISTRSGVLATLMGIVCALAIGACAVAGSSGSVGAGSADVLQQTFTGTHTVTSGVVHASLTVTPSGGAGALSGPLSVSVDGPFQLGAPGSRRRST